MFYSISNSLNQLDVRSGNFLKRLFICECLTALNPGIQLFEAIVSFLWALSDLDFGFSHVLGAFAGFSFLASTILVLIAGFLWARSPSTRQLWNQLRSSTSLMIQATGYDVAEASGEICEQVDQLDEYDTGNEAFNATTGLGVMLDHTSDVDLSE